MCGIVAAVSARNCVTILVEGLRRLEYRGYDSAGIAVIHAGDVVVERKAGKLANLEKELAGTDLRGTIDGERLL